MKTSSKSLLIVGLVATIICIIKCSVSVSDPGTGTSTDISKCLAFGTILDPDGNPAKNITVVMRPRDYLAVQRQLGKRIVENGYTVFSTATDDNGTYGFERTDSIPAGVYCIEARDGKTGNSLFIDSMVIDSQHLKNDTALRIQSPFVNTDNTLRPPSSITGTIRSADSTDGGFVFVYGLNTYGLIGRDGKFKLDTLPAGNWRLQIVVSKNGEEQISTLTAATVAGKPTILDTLCGIIYNHTGDTGGYIPSVNTLYSAGDTILLPGNNGDTGKPGYTFSGWNTRPDGSGIAYGPNDTLIVTTAVLVLYAQWTNQSLSVILISNGYGTVDASRDTSATGTTYHLSAAPVNGYQFSYWKTVKGTAVIADSNAAATTVKLTNTSVTIEGVFVLNSFKKQYFFDSLTGYCSPECFSVQQTSDKGYVLTGAIYEYYDNGTQGSGNPTKSYIFLVKTDVKGNLVWKHLYNTDKGFNTGYSIRQTTDGGFIIVGETTANVAGFDIVVIKTDAEGIVTWKRSFGGAEDDHGYAIQQTKDGGFIISGSTKSSNELGNEMVIKLDNSGTTVWSKTYDNHGRGNSICQTSDGGYILTGTYDDDSLGAHLIRLNSDGVLIWSKSYISPLIFQEGNTVVQTNDGGFILTGNTDNLKTYIIKTDSIGDTLWTSVFGESGNEFNCLSGSPTSDGGFVIIGQKHSPDAWEYKLFIAKINPQGTTQWTRLMNTGTFYVRREKTGSSIQETTDGGFVIGGCIEYSDYGIRPIVLIKTDVNGNME